MSQVVFNPTNEPLAAQYVGVLTTIEPDQRVRLDDARARHLLTTLGPRGLMALDFGDENKLDEIATQGRALNAAFKKKQVMNYNQTNEGRKQASLPYQTPPLHITAYAKELGMGILEPYNIKDDERNEIALLRKQNADITNNMASLMSKMEKMMTAMQEKGVEVPAESTATEMDVEKTRRRYFHLEKIQFEKFVTNRKEEVLAFPEENQREIQDKWKVEVPDKKYPY